MLINPCLLDIALGKKTVLSESELDALSKSNNRLVQTLLVAARKGRPCYIHTKRIGQYKVRVFSLKGIFFASLSSDTLLASYYWNERKEFKALRYMNMSGESGLLANKIEKQLSEYWNFQTKDALTPRIVQCTGPLGTFMVEAVWTALTGTPEDKCRHLAEVLFKSPVTIAKYGKTAIDKRVRSETGRAYKSLILEKNAIEEKWTLKRKTLDPTQAAIEIASELRKSPLTIVSYLTGAKDKRTKHEAIETFSRLSLIKKDLETLWDKCKQNPKEIAKRTGLKPISVLNYLRHSENKEIAGKAEALYRKAR